MTIPPSCRDPISWNSALVSAAMASSGFARPAEADRAMHLFRPRTLPAHGIWGTHNQPVAGSWLWAMNCGSTSADGTSLILLAAQAQLDLLRSAATASTRWMPDHRKPHSPRDQSNS